ncbi:MAG: hypothetical protein EBT93_16815, partial [Alphaproteobacteria bacterium]|nr:hypothetical protein [Alphaproteobacteria bacterium]
MSRYLYYATANERVGAVNRVIEAVQNTLHSIQNAPRTMKITLQISLDGLIIFLSLVSAILLRIETLGFL